MIAEQMHADMLVELAQRAEATREILRSHPSLDGRPDCFAFDAVRAMIDDADLAFGVWYDFATAPGIHYAVVKGVPLLRRIASGRRSEATKVVAIPCTCAEQAEALRRVIDEPQQLQ